MYLRHLRKFTSTREVSLEYLWEVLSLWETSKVDENEILLFAEQLYDMGPGFPSYTNDDVRAVIINVLEAFVMMYSNPTTKDDIPALKDCITMAKISPKEALQFLETYWQTVDWDSRLQRQRDSVTGNQIG